MRPVKCVCGGKPSEYRWRHGMDGRYVSCDECDCGTPASKTKADAVAAWNAMQTAAKKRTK